MRPWCRWCTWLGVALVAAVSHAVWETLHVSLYTAYEGIAGPLPLLVYATMGDVAYTVGALLFLTWVRGSDAWLDTALRRDYVVLGALGFGIALFVEYKALALGRWAYTDAMPLAPFFEVGVSPLLQMAVLLPCSVLLGTWLCRTFLGHRSEAH